MKNQEKICKRGAARGDQPMRRRISLFRSRPLAIATCILFVLLFVLCQSNALKDRDDIIREYFRTVPRGKKHSNYERDLLHALATMDADVAAQAQPVIRVVVPPAGTGAGIAGAAGAFRGDDVKTTNSNSNNNNKKKSYSMHPLTFGIPAKHVQDSVQPKGQVMSTVVPGDWSTYAYMPRAEQTPEQRSQLERDYYIDMQRSFFGLTWKKGGWDCLRHLELLASGCLPLFTNIDEAPRGVLALYPKRVLKLLLDFPGIANLTGVPGRISENTHDKNLDPKKNQRVVVIDEKQINLPLYAVAVNSLLEFTRDRLTTEAVAAHVLSRMGVPIVRPRRWFDRDCGWSSRSDGLMTRRKRRRTACDVVSSSFKSRPGSYVSSSSSALHENAAAFDDDSINSFKTNRLLPCPLPTPTTPTPTRVLFLSMEKVDVDYMTDTLLHGFKSLLGDANVVDYHRRSILYNTPATLLERDWGPKRTAQYGAGFSYAHSMLFALDSSDTGSGGGGGGGGSRSSSSSGTDADTFEQLLRMDIAAQTFDVVVLGLIHRKEPPLLREVCKWYPRERVAAIHGHDRPPTDDELEKYDACAKYQFVREAY